MGNCWFRGSSYINRVSSTAKSETPKIQSPSERDRSDESKLPSNAREVEAMRLDSAARNPLTAFSFEELRKVTNGFRQDSLIGGGGFGRVYKGAVGTDEPLQVAVKVHDGDNSFQGHREWLAEVIFLGHLSHPNLVKLVGYCCEGDHRVLVYEYMPLGSVESHLFSRTYIIPTHRHARPRVRAGCELKLNLRVRGDGAAGVGDEDEDRAGRGERARFPPRGREARDLPRFQDLQHPPRPRLQRQALRLRPRQGRPRRRHVPRLHPNHGHLRLRRPRVHHDRAPYGDERRVQLRGGAAGAGDGAQVAGQVAAGAGADAHRLGAADAHAQEEGAGHRRPQDRVRRLPGQVRAEGGHARVPLPQPEPQGATAHARHRRLPRAVAAAGAPARVRR